MNTTQVNMVIFQIFSIFSFFAWYQGISILKKSWSTLPTSFNIFLHFHTPMEMNTFSYLNSQFSIFSMSSPLATSSLLIYYQMSLSTPTTSSGWKLDKFVLSWIKAIASTLIWTLLLQCKSSYEALHNPRQVPLSNLKD